MKQKELTITPFSKNLVALRKAKGITQMQLAKVMGVSRRIIAYYEAESKQAPSDLLFRFAAALDVSADELVGTLTPKNREEEQQKAKIWKKLKKFEQLSKKDQKFIFHYINIATK